jgi:hypothetical protein
MMPPARSAAHLALVAMLVWPTLARSQVLAGRFHPEKQTFLVGEPIFIDFEITNTGNRSAWVDQRMGQPCIEPDPIEVVGAQRHELGSDASFGCFGGIAGDCLGGDLELKPGAKQTTRIFLNASFRLDHAGTYTIHARRSVPVYPSDDLTASRTATTMEFASDFQIMLQNGSEDQLKAAFQSYVEDARTPNLGDHWLAVEPIEEMAPAFLEDLILQLADTPGRASPEALLRLNSPKSKQKLAELASHAGDVQQQAILALAKTRDPGYLPVLIGIAGKSEDGNRDFAIWGAGLFGEDAVPFLVSMLTSPDVNVRAAATRALGLTKSRSAVSVLIGALPSRDEELHRDVIESLAELTHHSLTDESRKEPFSTDEYRRWSKWWRKNELTAPIYSTENCPEPQPLD